MGKSGYAKCVDLVKGWISAGKTSLTEEEIRNDIARNIGFDKQFGVIDKYFNALLIFGFIKPNGEKYQILKENLNG